MCSLHRQALSPILPLEEDQVLIVVGVVVLGYEGVYGTEDQAEAYCQECTV